MKEPGPDGASSGRQGEGQGGGGVWDIVLQNPNRYAEAGTRRLRPWLERLVCSLVPAAAGEERSLGVRFTGDREMRRVNRSFRGKDKTTDVLSFPGEEEHVGDILISVPTARRQAAEAGHPAERELRILLLHGLLHCMGYDHETDDGTMERLERKLRRVWIDPSPPDPLSHPLPPTGRGGSLKGREGAPLSRRPGGDGRGDGGEGAGDA